MSPRTSLLHPARVSIARRGCPSSRRRVGTAAGAGVLLAAGLLAVPTQAQAATTHARTRFETHAVQCVLTVLNEERAKNHRSPLRLNADLVRTARAHDAAMAGGDVMSHQLRSESSLGARTDRAGYHWTWVGENIGETSQLSASGAVRLERAMYGEHAPNDGHRANILSSRFRDVGVDVFLDQRHHRLWFTTDFGRR